MKKAFLLLHGAVFLAGFTGILGRLITLNEGSLVWWRLFITVITLWLIFFFQKKIVRVSTTDLLKLFGVGAIAAMHWVAFYGSIKYANISVALVCFSSIGFFTAFLEPLILRRKFNYIELLLGLLVIAGIYLIFQFDPRYQKGIIIGIISAVLGSLFPIFSRGLLQKHFPATVTLYELTGGLIFLSVMMPLYLYFFPVASYLPSLPDLGWLFILAWFCTVLAFNLSMRALKKISAFTVNLTYNLEPLYGIILAFIVFREDKLLRPEFYWGLSLILLSVISQTFLVYRAHRKL
jgi:drug/metabolite transporter (DMT)-like permease